MAFRAVFQPFDAIVLLFMVEGRRDMIFDERRLASKFRSGNPDVFAEVYDRYSDHLMGFAFRLTGDRTDAEDLVQEVFLAAWSGRDSFQGKAKLLSWLLGIMTRRWRDRCRQRNLSTVVLANREGEVVFPILKPVVSRMESGTLDRLALNEALDSLEHPFREALLLVRSQGLTYKEAAEVMGEPVGTVKWRVSEAVKVVQRYLNAVEEDLHDLQLQQDPDRTARRSSRR